MFFYMMINFFIKQVWFKVVAAISAIRCHINKADDMYDFLGLLFCFHLLFSFFAVIYFGANAGIHGHSFTVSREMICSVSSICYFVFIIVFFIQLLLRPLGNYFNDITVQVCFRDYQILDNSTKCIFATKGCLYNKMVSFIRIDSLFVLIRIWIIH